MEVIVSTIVMKNVLRSVQIIGRTQQKVIKYVKIYHVELKNKETWSKIIGITL